MKFAVSLMVLAGTTGLFCACGDAPSNTRQLAPAMHAETMTRHMAGTSFTAHIHTDLPPQTAQHALSQAFDKAQKWERILSSRDADSELNRLNAAPAGIPFPVSKELASALRLACRLAEETGGAFDPTLGPCIRLWHRARSRGKLPDPADLHRALSATGYGKLRQIGHTVTKLEPGMRIDLGGIGKGLMLDAMAAELRRHGITSYLLTDTSDILAGDPPPGREYWTYKQGGRIVPLLHAAASTSGSEHQHIAIGSKTYSHIIDPRTGIGIDGALPHTTVHASAAAEADARATAAAIRAAWAAAHP